MRLPPRRLLLVLIAVLLLAFPGRSLAVERGGYHGPQVIVNPYVFGDLRQGQQRAANARVPGILPAGGALCIWNPYASGGDVPLSVMIAGRQVVYPMLLLEEYRRR